MAYAINKLIKEDADMSATLLREWIDKVMHTIEDPVDQQQPMEEDNVNVKPTITIDNLIDHLTSPGEIDVINAGTFSGKITFGSLQSVGAGRILRANPPYPGKWFGFEYFKQLPNGTPIQANLNVFGQPQMKPGDHFIEEV